jgi:hypothetical protein
MNCGECKLLRELGMSFVTGISAGAEEAFGYVGRSHQETPTRSLSEIDLRAVLEIFLD